MTKSQIGASETPTAEQQNERQRSHSQPPSLRKHKREDLRYPDVPIRTLKAHFFKGKVPARPAKGRAVPVSKAIRRTLTPSQKLLLIQIRFGSLTDFSRPQLSFAKLTRRFSVSASTAWYVINSFVKNGYRIIDRRCFNHRMRRVIGSPELEEWLVCKDTLEKWAALSMEARARKLYNEHGVYVKPHTLRAFYRRHRIHYTKPQPAYR